MAKIDSSEIKEQMVYVGRCTKVVKGGRRFSFSAVVVAGDGKGKCGIGSGKAVEVSNARSKAMQSAMRSMTRIPLREGRTIHHDVSAQFGGCKVIMRPAPAGTGVIAGGAVRALLEVLGLKDIVTKIIGTTNPHNALKAAMKALLSTQSPRFIAEKRNKSLVEILGSGNNEHFSKKSDADVAMNESPAANPAETTGA